MCLLATALWYADAVHAQQSPDGGQTALQSAETALDASQQQDLPTGSLQDQQLGVGGQPQDTVEGGLDPQQNQLDGLDRPADFDRQDASSQGAGGQDRSVIRGGIGQRGQPGMESVGRGGELGVFVVQGAGPGVPIAGIAGSSAASEAGLQSGDVILQINGQDVSAPGEVTRIIRATPAGQAVTLHIMRNGEAQDITATLHPAGERYRTNFRGMGAVGMTGDLESRTRQLESQLALVMQELQQLRQEVMQLRSGQSGAPGGVGAQRQPGELAPGTTPSALDTTDPNATQPDLDAIPPQEPAADSDTGLPF
jgi:hypothetical protein